MTDPYDQNFDKMLNTRGSRQLELLQIFIETNFQERNFTLIDHGCGSAALLGILADWYPEASFYGVDISENYTNKWQTEKNKHKNIVDILVSNFTLWDSALPNNVDIIFSNGAVMYLNSTGKENYLNLMAEHTDYLALRDIQFSEFGLISNKANAHYTDVIIRNNEYVFQTLADVFGERPAPLNQEQINNSPFQRVQYALDKEVYIKHPDAGLDMPTLLKTELYASIDNYKITEGERKELFEAYRLYMSNENVIWRNWYFQVLSRN